MWEGKKNKFYKKKIVLGTKLVKKVLCALNTTQKGENKNKIIEVEGIQEKKEEKLKSKGYKQLKLASFLNLLAKSRDFFAIHRFVDNYHVRKIVKFLRFKLLLKKLITVVYPRQNFSSLLFYFRKNLFSSPLVSFFISLYLLKINFFRKLIRQKLFKSFIYRQFLFRRRVLLLLTIIRYFYFFKRKNTPLLSCSLKSLNRINEQRKFIKKISFLTQYLMLLLYPKRLNQQKIDQGVINFRFFYYFKQIKFKIGKSIGDYKLLAYSYKKLQRAPIKNFMLQYYRRTIISQIMAKTIKKNLKRSLLVNKYSISSKIPIINKKIKKTGLNTVLVVSNKLHFKKGKKNTKRYILSDDYIISNKRPVKNKKTV